VGSVPFLIYLDYAEYSSSDVREADSPGSDASSYSERARNDCLTEPLLDRDLDLDLEDLDLDLENEGDLYDDSVGDLDLDLEPDLECESSLS